MNERWARDYRDSDAKAAGGKWWPFGSDMPGDTPDIQATQVISRLPASCPTPTVRYTPRRWLMVIVTDDGSSVDYYEVRQSYPEVLWLRHDTNKLKKHAQATAFNAAPWADYYLTIDSDSALEPRAIEEGMKPFNDPEVKGVACVEMASNWNKNVLTIAIAARSLAFQLFAMSSQSVTGSVLICPGAASLYRGEFIRRILPSYLGETFCGQPCVLGDDTMLTLYALMEGKTVQQPTAFCFPAYPEKLKHHLRQWVRWMRASTIRTIWRQRYLPMHSYGWIFGVWQLAAFFAGVSASVLVVIAWPASESLAIGGLGGLFAWPVVLGFRLLTIQRSDMNWLGRLRGIALMPLAALWYLLVLRQIRFYGIATCATQEWVTRKKVEVRA